LIDKIYFVDKETEMEYGNIEMCEQINVLEHDLKKLKKSFGNKGQIRLRFYSLPNFLGKDLIVIVVWLM
jgi:hypothetical protein